MDAHVRSLPGALIAAVLALALALPGAASASPNLESILMDDNLLLYRGDSVATATLKELKGLGVDRGLSRAGAQAGDLVRIGGFSFTYEPDDVYQREPTRRERRA